MYITEHWVLFKKTKNPRHLMLALLLVISQGRLMEVAWSIVCWLFHRPSLIAVATEKTSVIQEAIMLAHEFHPIFLSREEIVQRYGQEYSLEGLPIEFNGARSESIAKTKFGLIIGEYSNKSARLVFATDIVCRVYDYYDRVSGVRHIHSVHASACSSYIFVSTGDSNKFLDKWSVFIGGINWQEKLRRRLAGYTAAVRLDGKDYFGTDFSSRPNYLKTLCGKRYMFPYPAYNLFVLALGTVQNRYVISLSSALAPLSQ